MSDLVIRQLSKSFRRASPGPGDGATLQVVRDLSLNVAHGEMLALLGASGSGKTTLLRCIGGLETPDAGEIEVAGTPLYSSTRAINVPAFQRAMGMVFQSYALWPHLTVADNIAYPLERRRLGRATIGQRVAAMLELVDCAALAGRFPHQLSGGQQQRVALARALVAEPRLVLFDEPLSNLDTNLREQLRFEIRKLRRRVAFTGVYVTHDHAEAIFIADRIAVLGEGRLLQVGEPGELYRAPANAAIAAFLGMTNTLRGQIESGPAGPALVCAAGRLELAATRLPGSRAAQLHCHPGRVTLGAAATGLPARVLDRIRVSEDGVQYVVELADGNTWLCGGALTEVHAPGASVGLRVAPDHLHLFEVPS